MASFSVPPPQKKTELLLENNSLVRRNYRGTFIIQSAALRLEKKEKMHDVKIPTQQLIMVEDVLFSSDALAQQVPGNSLRMKGRERIDSLKYQFILFGKESILCYPT